jgi:ketosteroid isomerase-like protein
MMHKTIKLICTMFFGAIVSLSCQNQVPPQEPVIEEESGVLSISPSMDEDIATVEKYLAALLTSDSATLRQITTSSFYSSLAKDPEDSSDIEAIIKDWAGFQESRSNQRNEQVAASSLKVREGEQYTGTWVQYWGTYSATINETGVEITVPYFSNSLLIDGKIQRTYAYYDRLAIWQAQGYEITKIED